MYVMEGGYKKFYNEFPDLCSPKSYRVRVNSCLGSGVCVCGGGAEVDCFVGGRPLCLEGSVVTGRAGCSG